MEDLNEKSVISLKLMIKEINEKEGQRLFKTTGNKGELIETIQDYRNGIRQSVLSPKSRKNKKSPPLPLVNLEKLSLEDSSNCWRDVILKSYLKKESVNTVAWSPNGNWLVSGSENNIILSVVDSEGNIKNINVIEYNSSINSLMWSPTLHYGQLWLAGGFDDGTIKIWRINDRGQWKELSSFSAHDYNIRSVSWSPDGKWLASSAFDRTIKIWFFDKKGKSKEIDVLRGKENPLFTSLSWSLHQGQWWLASGSNDGKISIWSINNKGEGKEISILEGHQEYVSSVSWSPIIHQGERWLASTAWDSTVRIWAIDDNGFGKDSYVIEILLKVTPDDFSIQSVDWSPDGKFLVTGDLYDSVMIWDINLDFPKEISINRDSRGSVYSVKWSPVLDHEQQWIAVGSGDGLRILGKGKKCENLGEWEDYRIKIKKAQDYDRFLNIRTNRNN